MRRPGAAAVVLAVLSATPARPAETCPGFFAQGRPPVLTAPKLARDTLPLCFDGFAVLHSGLSRTPLYAAEHLTRAGVQAARLVARDDSFHEEERLPEAARARLDDYVRSGFDRGHLAPAGDMASEAAQAQSFSLANIVPQNRPMNRGVWSGIEESVRRLALDRGELYVVTGAVFAGGTAEAIKGRVLVPSRLYKAVYDPVRAEAGAYLAANVAGGSWQTVPVADLREAAGIDVFPSLPERVKAAAMSLPEPRDMPRGEGAERRRRERPEDASWLAWLGHELDRAVRRALRQALRSIF